MAAQLLYLLCFLILFATTVTVALARRSRVFAALIEMEHDPNQSEAQEP